MDYKTISGVLFLLVLSSLTASTESQEFCPTECHCDYENADFFVDCSSLGLTDLPHFPELDIRILDLSENMFTFIPPQLSQLSNLRYLDLSSNLLSFLPPYSFDGLHSLKQLNLSKNNLTNWAEIFPNEILQRTPSLEELSLAENQFTSFSSNDASLVLVSGSLKYLDLSNCKITKISGKEVIQGMPNLEHLKLSANPIHGISDMQSSSLKLLDLSNCKLSTLQPTALSGLDSLAYINLSRNTRLTLSAHGNISSPSLKRINLSHCNMDSIDLGGFPNLMTLVMRQNMIRQLTRDSFMANPLLETIDISYNAINQVQPDAFRRLVHLRNLDLSFNMIPRIDGKTFKDNELLTHINLSRNYIGRLQRIMATSLAYVNISWCEIMTIDVDALGAMPSLIDLDLSNNLLSADPENIASESLQTLDLSMCRITSIRNTTFAKLPALQRINLSGNRFTTPFRVDFFDNNPYLGEIWLGDNPWRCECGNRDFHNFFEFLTDPPRKVNDRKQLRCTTPEDFYGATWEAACRSVWFPQESMGTTEMIWTYFMLAILAFFGFFCLFSSVKKVIHSRQKLAAERERRENIQELREIARDNQLRLRQEAQLNAPDARESRPPCYEDAILLPKLDSVSFASLDELLLRGKRRKKRKQRQSTGDEQPNADGEDDQVEVRLGNRSRSENVLSVRGTVYREPTDALNRDTSPIYQSPVSNRTVTATVIANVHASPLGSRASRETVPSPTEDAELHYHSTDILGINRSTISTDTADPKSPTITISRSNSAGPSRSIEHIQNFNDRSYENSPYAKRKVKPLQHLNPNGSIEEITDFEGYEASPYAKRRIKHMASFKGDHDRPSLPARPPPLGIYQMLQDNDADSEIVLVEDHFLPEQSKPDLDDYTVVNEADVRISPTSKESQLGTDNDPNSSSGSSIEIIPLRKDM
ncbi:toll-like receptor 2 [Toxorhynchites rutilus septentrionalis]|uniref:toll-like receptor 2 n=1 Tax=Toxorhynchites rutilus septentrionalis TaxID=329112 RepID=UPI00247A6F81|nr:toll-like receptor 2 [Toxorhynchites rutilus septentrionalis]